MSKLYEQVGFHKQGDQYYLKGFLTGTLYNYNICSCSNETRLIMRKYNAFTVWKHGDKFGYSIMSTTSGAKVTGRMHELSDEYYFFDLKLPYRHIYIIVDGRDGLDQYLNQKSSIFNNGPRII